jgi:hypothetical protein
MELVPDKPEDVECQEKRTAFLVSKVIDKNPDPVRDIVTIRAEDRFVHVLAHPYHLSNDRKEVKY